MQRALLVAAILAVTGASAHAGEHPPMLEREPGCEYWVGTTSGNDKEVRAILSLCVDATTGAVKGHAQWSSLVSGWNTRELAGTSDGTHVVLADVRIVDSHPINGWHFCPIDRWDLTRTGDHLDGTYDSAACRDHAAVTLTRVADPSVTPPHPPDAAPAPPSHPPDAAPPPRRASDRGCHCATTSGPDGATAALVVLAIISASRRRSAGGTRSRRRRRARR